MVEQNALTVIVPIALEEVAALKEILHKIGEDSENNPFRKTPSTHFARWVILDLDYEPELPLRLLFSSNYDGNFESYMRELVEQIGPETEQIWNKCEGYSAGTAKDLARFTQFIKQHALKPQVFYIAFRGATVETILNSGKIREQLDLILDFFAVQPLLSQLLAPLYQLAASTPIPAPQSGGSAKQERDNSSQPKLSLRGQVIEWLVGIRPGVRNPNRSKQTKPELIAIEDKVGLVQNQMTIISPLKPQLLPQILVRLFLFITNLQARASYGSLSGISTIHFARWVIIDHGKNLLFESNYDGSWENYIDDFVAYASVGMNSIWGNAVGFPIGGARDVEGFKEIIRKYQIPSQVFYSAYSQATVKNILNDLQISKAVTEFLRQKGVARFITGSY